MTIGTYKKNILKIIKQKLINFYRWGSKNLFSNIFKVIFGAYTKN